MSRSNARSWSSFLFLALALVPVAFMVSGASLGADEGNSGRYAIQPGIRAFGHHLLNDPEAEALMPLHQGLLWMMSQLIEPSELHLRGLNLVFVLGAVMAVWGALRRVGAERWTIVFAVQPYLWFYANEARPYALQILLGAVLLYGMTRRLTDSERDSAWALWFGPSCVALLLSSVLASLTVVGAVAVVVLHAMRGHRFRRTEWLTFAICLLFAGGVVAYHLWVLGRGVRGADLWDISLLVPLYNVYELTGAKAFGPGYEDLRMAASGGAWQELMSGQLALMTGMVGAVVLQFSSLLYGFMHLRWREREGWLARSALVVVTTAFVGLTACSYLTGKAFWARHLASAFPFYAVAACLFYRRAFAGGGFMRALTLLAVVSLVAGAATYRFAARYAKSDFRAAAGVVQGALSRGETVWWLAGGNGARYYGLPVGKREELLVTQEPPLEELGGPGRPEWVVLSSVEMLRKVAAVEQAMEAHGYGLHARLDGIRVFNVRPGAVEDGGKAGAVRPKVGDGALGRDGEPTPGESTGERGPRTGR